MMKIAEYLSLGMPVVGYNLLETRRTAGVAAMLVRARRTSKPSPMDRMLARDPARRRRLAYEARHRAAELTWDHSERALLEAYASLTAGADRCARGALGTESLPSPSERPRAR